MTRIAVALCTYNGERYLADLLDSVAAQERRPDELVVCDDGSSDGTVALLEAFARQAPFDVRIEVNPRTLGVTKNFERAIERCTADLIALCDQDDIWYPKKLLRASEAFERQPGLGYVFSDADLMTDAGLPAERRMWDAVGFFPSRRQAATDGRLLELLVVYTFVQGAAMTFRSDLRDVLLPIPHGWMHDAWIALVAAFVRPYVMIDEPLLRYRLHEGQEIGVPSSVLPDDTGLRRWKVRLAQAPEKVSLRKADVHRQRRRTQSMLYREAAERVEATAPAYTSERGGQLQPGAEHALRELRERSHHLRVRGFLPDARLKRIAPIAKELRSKRYGRYSAGVMSALQDFVS